MALKQFIKDYGGLAISLAALTVSGSVAYMTTLSERLDVSAALTDDMPMLGFGGGTLKSVTFGTRIVLINSGNRPIAITAFRLGLYQVRPGKEEFPDCSSKAMKPQHDEHVYLPQGAFSPIVVKPMDVAIIPLYFQRDFTLPKRASLTVKGAANRFQAQPGDANGSIRIITCLETKFAAPGGAIRESRWQVAATVGDSLGQHEGGAQTSPGVFAQDRTARLVKESRWPF